MRRLTFIASCIFLINIVNAQSDIKEDEKQRYLMSLSQKSKVLVVDFSLYSMNIAGEVKDEMLKWPGKINSVELDETTKTLTVVHNGLIRESEVKGILSKYNVSLKSIISYQ